MEEEEVPFAWAWLDTSGESDRSGDRLKLKIGAGGRGLTRMLRMSESNGACSD